MTPATLLVRPRPVHAPRLKMFCFPFAGGDAMAYRDWPALLPADVEVIAIQLPGRPGRPDRPYARLEPLLDLLEDRLAPELDVPFVFFGHSMGAVVSFELSRRLARSGKPAPLHLFVSGRNSPTLKNERPPIHDLPDGDLIAAIRRLGGTPEGVLRDPDLVAWLLPTLRADLAVAETYALRESEPLSLPISAFGGTSDPYMLPEGLTAWREATTSSFSSEHFPGDHFFIQTSQRALLTRIGETLALLARAGAPAQAAGAPAQAAPTTPDGGVDAIAEALRAVRRPIVLLERDGALAVAHEDGARSFDARSGETVLASAPALGPADLGSPTFLRQHGVKYAYVAGAMAGGIASEELVVAMANAGMLAIFGSAGLSLERVERAIDHLQRTLVAKPFGVNLVHSPSDPSLEQATVDLLLRKGVRRVCASAFFDLSLAVVRYRFSGIHRDRDGVVVTPHQVLAKISRPELAAKFLSPPPREMLRELVARGSLTEDQAALAAELPVAQDVTAEADSGGHTDNRPSHTLTPSILALRDELQLKHGYSVPLRVGAAGGIGTPSATAAAFAMGADYVMTGSINQACQEAGTSAAVREMLAAAGQADVAMAPAADMFEMGVKVQVLKRGTMFAVRARKLYDLYRAHEALDRLPDDERKVLERHYFKSTVEEAWVQARAFWLARSPREVERAEREPRHKMALVFRSYLGRSSEWANAGDPTRRSDYQVWCGPAMGAFNEWVRGSFLEPVAERRVVTLALNLMLGAAVLTRAHWLRAQGVTLPIQARSFSPMRIEAIQAALGARDQA